MKTVLVLCVVVAVSLANPVQQRWDTVHQQCQATPGLHVDDNIFEQLKRGENPTLPDNFGAHAHCMLLKLDLQDANGNALENGVREAVQRSVSDKSKVNQITTECTANSETKEKSALKLFGCFSKHRIDIGQF